MTAPATIKMEICRYYESPSGCVRGDKCYYAHGDEGFKRARSASSEAHFHYELKRKIFIGGLSPAVNSDVLREFFETNFGPVEDAVVIGSQAGEHIHGRGFGFVTFKHEESAVAAVEVHFVTILGKKAEIKGAVPKSMIPISSAALSGNPPSLSKQLLPQTFQPFSGGTVIEESGDGKKQWSLWVDRLRSEQQQGGIPTEGSENLSKHEIPWVRKFVKWLPDFLREVSKRLKDGEWYPLSSLKGDFRATCGMELDHVSLGYQKLSDFVRSMPGICQMKIVPVGRGPATHMVLLEPLHKRERDSPPPTIDDQPEGCYQSYADAAYHGLVGGGVKTSAGKNEVPNFPEVKSRFKAGHWLGEEVEGRLRPAKMAGAEGAVDENERFLTFLRSGESHFAPWQLPCDETLWERRLFAFFSTFRSYFKVKKPEVDGEAVIPSWVGSF